MRATRADKGAETMTVAIIDLTKVIVLDATNKELSELFSSRIEAAKKSINAPSDMARLLNDIDQLSGEIIDRLVNKIPQK